MGYQGGRSSFRRLLMLSGSGVLSGAGTLLRSETDGLAFDFTDQSAVIKDTATPANAYSSTGTVSGGVPIGPGGKLTYSAPSAKLCLQSNGFYAYAAHNLFLNSAAPANQTVTVITGATYAIDITGSVTTTLSSATTGTITAGTTTFTAASTSLTFGSTSGTGTVCVRRTPSSNTYVATAGAIVYSLPYEWNTSGTALGVRIEEARTNPSKYCRDLTRTSWTKRGTVTVTKTATGIDGVANSATAVRGLGAGGANDMFEADGGVGGKFSNSVSVAVSMFIKKVSSTGTLNIVNTSSGLGWTVNFSLLGSGWERIHAGHGAVTVGTAFTSSGAGSFAIQFSNSSGTLDFDVDFIQEENNTTFITSPIETAASTVTRAADQITIATTLFPTSVTAQTIYIAAQRPFKDVSGRMLNLANGNNYFMIHDDGSQVTAEIRETAAGVTGGGGLGDHGVSTPFKVALAGQANDSGTVLNGGTPVTDVTVTMPTSYTTLTIGSPTTWINGHVRQVMALPRRMSNAELQTVTT
jgi:hypothetical protein